MTQAAVDQKYWWEEDEVSLHETLFGVVKFLDTHQNNGREANLRHLRLFSNTDVLGLGIHSYALSEASSSNVDRLKLNIIYSCCDTVTNKIAKNKVKPMFLTKKGNWSLKQKAQNLEQFTQGIFYETKLYQKSPKTFLSGAVFGTGFLHIYRHKDKIKAENVFSDEIRVENTDGMNGCPRAMYREKFISRDVLIRKFPKFKAKIKAAKRAESTHPLYASLPDAVKVVEAWHLRSDDDEDDGVHSICIENATLIKDEWKKDYFPFVSIRWSDKLLGFFGQGLAEQLTGLQIEINKILMTLEKAFNMCVPKMMLENGSKVVSAHLNNDLEDIIRYSGIKPDWTTPAPVNPQYFEYLRELVTRAYEKAGISQLSANAQKPAGLDSGKALREFNDIESERYMLLGQAWEDFHLECSERFIDLAKEISEEKGKDYTVTVKSNRFLKKIKWSDVQMAKDDYQLQVFPTSFLSATPAGRLADIQELVQAGFFPKEFAMKLLDFPDLDWATSLFTAAIDDIDATIEMITEGKYEGPDGFQKLDLGVQMMQSAYLRMKREGLPEAKLDHMRRWISEAKDLMPPPPGTLPPGGTPGLTPTGPQQGTPMPAPQNQLLPNAAA